MLLGISWQALLSQIVCFGILLALLVMFAYRPIMRMLDERSNRIKDSMDKAEEIKQEAARAGVMVKEQLDSARKDGQSIVAQAEQLGERLREEAREEAKKEGEAILARAQAEIGRERDEAIDRLRAEFVDLSLMAAEKVIKESLDREKHMRLIEEVLEESGGLRKE